MLRQSHRCSPPSVLHFRVAFCHTCMKQAMRSCVCVFVCVCVCGCLLAIQGNHAEQRPAYCRAGRVSTFSSPRMSLRKRNEGEEREGANTCLLRCLSLFTKMHTHAHASHPRTRLTHTHKQNKTHTHTHTLSPCLVPQRRLIGCNGTLRSCNEHLIPCAPFAHLTPPPTPVPPITAAAATTTETLRACRHQLCITQHHPDECMQAVAAQAARCLCHAAQRCHHHHHHHHLNVTRARCLIRYRPPLWLRLQRARQWHPHIGSHCS